MAIGNDQSLSIVIQARDQASKVFNSVQGNLSKLESHIRRAEGASRAFGLGLAAAGAASAGFGTMAIKAAADAEQMRIAFETMLGSAEKADDFIRDLVDFAKKTPFELKGLEQASKQLLAYGFEQDAVLPNLRALGDIASGVGMDKLPNLILAFGQVKAATRLTGMELRQFTEAGVPLLDELAQHFNTTAAEVKDMVSAGTVGFSDVQTAIMNLTDEGGRFNNLMGKQADSLSGKWSNLQDAFDIFLRNEGQKLIDWSKRVVDGLIVFVEDVLPPLITRLEEFSNWLKDNQSALYVVAGAIVGALLPALLALIVAFAAGAIALAPWLIGGAIVGGIVAGVMWIIKNWDTLKAKAVELWASLKQVFADGGNFLIGIAESFANAWIKGVNAIVDALNTIQVDIPDWVPKYGGNTFGIDLKRVPEVSIPRFEHGGIVNAPTGVPVPIMAHGQERILPASRSDGGSIITVTINNPVVRSQDDIRAFKKQVEDSLRGVIRDRKLQTV